MPVFTNRMRLALSELDLFVGRPGPCGSPRKCASQRVLNGRVGVPVNQAEAILEQIHVSVAVDVPKDGPVATLENNRVRSKPTSPSGQTSNHALRSTLHPALRTRCASPVRGVNRPTAIVRWCANHSLPSTLLGGKLAGDAKPISRYVTLLIPLSAGKLEPRLIAMSQSNALQKLEEVPCDLLRP